MKWFLKGLQKYAVFNGRAGRREFWLYCLCGYLIGVVLYLIDLNIGSYTVWYGIRYGLLCSFFTVFLLIPNTSVSVRRLHDSGKNGWWMLLLLIPIIGSVVLTIFWCLASEPRDNVYGPASAA